MKQHLLSVSLAAVAATTASLAVQQTTFHTIPQPTYITITDRIPAEDMVIVFLRREGDPVENPDQASEIVVPMGQRFVITQVGSPSPLNYGLRFDGIGRDVYGANYSEEIGYVADQGTVITYRGSQAGPQGVWVFGYMEDI